MARYTVELKTLMESDNVAPLLKDALSRYPMYTPSVNDEYVAMLIPTREQLNNKLLNHYKYREIAFETVGRFLEELEKAMDEIMPYYNQLYKSVEIMGVIEDPFGNVDVIEEYTEERNDDTSGNASAKTVTTGTDKNNSTSTSEALSKTLSTDTPQGNISKLASEIDTVSHADQANWNKGSTVATASGEAETSSDVDSTSQNTQNTKSTVHHTFTKKGNQGVNTYAHDMNELRETFLNVTMQIIEDQAISDLFMQLF